jgi:hypothetical protein
MNKRFVIVGVVLGVLVALAILFGSPYFSEIDMNR